MNKIKTHTKTLILIALTLSSCSVFSPKPKPINIKGSFKISMGTGAQYFKDTPNYPVSGKLVNDVPYLNQTILPAGSGAIGVYKNTGLRCLITWTAIVLPNGNSISNANGVAISDCGGPGGELKQGEIVSANWN